MSTVLRRADLEANWGWVACGQVALAALLGAPLPRVRPACPAHAWMNQTDMRSALALLGAKCWSTPYAPPVEHLHPREWPSFGLAHVQFRGPWELPNAAASVVVRRSLRYSHWVAVSSAAAASLGEPMVCDINAVDRDVNGGWLPRSLWERDVLALLIKASSIKATGGWWIRSAFEVDRASAAPLLEGTR